MWLSVLFTESGLPKLGLSPTVKVREVATGTVAVAAGVMTELGDGFYRYDFSTYDPAKDYVVVYDSVTLLGAERYVGDKLSIDQSLLPLAEIPGVVWDEILTGTTHNIPTSAGRRLRESSGGVVHTGRAQGAGTGTNQIVLDADTSADNGAYDPAAIAIVAGAGSGQSRLILQYSGSTRTATVDRDWKVAPDGTSDFIITTHPGREHVNEGLVVAATADTITLNTNASSVDAAYVGQIVLIRSGKGADQACKVSSYDGTTRTATLCKPWGDIPNGTSAYVMLPTGFFDGNELAGVTATAVRTELALELAGIVSLLKSLRNKREIKKTGSVWSLVIYDDDGLTPIFSKELQDITGSAVTDLIAGALAKELASVI